MQHVSVIDEEIDKYALKVAAARSELTIVDWDSSGWHFCADAAVKGPLTAQYIFVMDALNFCFWPSEGLEYDTLALALKAVLVKDNAAFSAENLKLLTEQQLASWFPTDLQLPVLAERVARVREVGEVLLNEFEGLAANLVLAAKGSAVQLVRLVLMYFPGFRDTTVYQGTLLHLYKRAQILVGDLWAAYGRDTDRSHPYAFGDIDQLTMFADYRIPQILRDIGILQYDASLSYKVDNKELVPFGSAEEAEIRAATVVAVERLQQSLLKCGVKLLVLEVDWLLWQTGEAVKDTMAPHHRTLTIYY
jgi:hypothetical protein